MRRVLTVLLLCGSCPISVRAATPVDQESVASLINQLRTGDRIARQDAAEALGKMGPVAEDAIPALTDALQQVSTLRPAANTLAAIGPKAWPPLLKVMQGNSWDSKHQAAYNALQHSEARPTLELFFKLRRAEGSYLQILRDNADQQRLTTLSRLRSGDKQPLLQLPFLLLGLKSPDWQERLQAIEALAALGPLARPAIPALMAALEDEWPLEGSYSPFNPFHDYGIRAAAVKTLLAVGPAAERRLLREGLPRLIVGLENGTDTTRAHTATALGLLGPRARPAIPALLRQLRNVNQQTDPSVNALVAIGPDSIPGATALLEDEAQDVRAVGVVTLAAFGKQASKSLPKLAALSKDRAANVRNAVAELIVAIDKEGAVAISVLSSLMQDQDEWVRGSAASQLSKFGPRARAELPSLYAALASKDPSIAILAAETIIAINGPTPESTRYLLNHLNSISDDWHVRKALRDSGKAARAAVPPLLKMLDDPYPDVVLDVAWILTGISPSDAARAVPAIVRGLKLDKWDDTKYALAAGVLRDIGPAAREAAPALLALLASNRLSDNTRREMIQAIRQIGFELASVRPALARYLANDEQLPWASQVAAHLDPDGPLTVPSLIAVLHYPDLLHQGSAMVDLARLGKRSRPAVPLLERMLQEKDGWLRYRAALALIQITGQKEPYLDVIQRGIQYDYQAVHALQTLPPEATWAVPLLLKSLSHPDRYIRAAAAESLSTFGSAAHEATPILIRLLRAEWAREPRKLEYHLMYAIVPTLGAIGPAAKDALPTLRDMMPGSDPFLYSQLVDAIRRIDPESQSR